MSSKAFAAAVLPAPDKPLSMTTRCSVSRRPAGRRDGAGLAGAGGGAFRMPGVAGTWPVPATDLSASPSVSDLPLLLMAPVYRAGCGAGRPPPADGRRPDSAAQIGQGGGEGRFVVVDQRRDGFVEDQPGSGTAEWESEP